VKVAIKIYGERNSGTNYLESLLDKNLNVNILRFQLRWYHSLLLKLLPYDKMTGLLFYLQRKKMLGWKHGCPRVEDILNYDSERLIIITITKNSYSYLLSLQRNPYHFKGKKEPEFINFLKNRWRLIRRDFCSAKSFQNPVQLWNIKNESYLNLSSKTSNTVINITDEELIDNPEHFIRNLVDQESVEWKNQGRVSNIESSTKDSKRTFQEDRSHYLNIERVFLNPQLTASISSLT
jgi:hypothetical protein